MSLLRSSDIPEDDWSRWSEIGSLVLEDVLLFSGAQWQDEHEGCCWSLNDVRACFVRLGFFCSSWRTCCCCFGMTWMFTSAKRSSSRSVFTWLENNSSDLNRSLSSVNRPEIGADAVDEALNGFEFVIALAEDDDADDDEVDAWVFGIALACCCGCAACRAEAKDGWGRGAAAVAGGGGGGGGGGRRDEGGWWWWWWWWWWFGRCGWRSKSPVAVSFSSTNTTRTYTRRRSSVIRSLRRELR